MNQAAQRFFSSPLVAKFRAPVEQAKAEKWAAMSPRFRRFLARAAGLSPEVGEQSWQQLSDAQRSSMFVELSRFRRSCEQASEVFNA